MLGCRHPYTIFAVYIFYIAFEIRNIHLLPKVAAGGAVDQVDSFARDRVKSEVKIDLELSLHGGDGLVNIGRGDNWKIKKKYE